MTLKRVLMASVCAGVFSLSAALAEVESSSSLHYYNSGNIYAVYTEGTSLNVSADVDSAVAKTLHVGERLEVLPDPAPDTLPKLEEGSLSEPWLHVALVSHPKTTGYVWAGNLAKTVVDVDLDADGVNESVLTAYAGTDLPSMNPNTSQKPVSEPVAHYSIKILQDGKTIVEKYFSSPYVDANSLTTTVYTPAGFSPMLSIIGQDLSPEACGVPGGKHLFSWSKNELREGFAESYISEASVFSDDFELVFPLDRGGETNKIKVLRESQSDWNDNCQCYKTIEKSAWDYTWTGTGFKKTAAKAK